MHSAALQNLPLPGGEYFLISEIGLDARIETWRVANRGMLMLTFGPLLRVGARDRLLRMRLFLLR
jgi:hypothetical protein